MNDNLDLIIKDNFTKPAITECKNTINKTLEKIKTLADLLEPNLDKKDLLELLGQISHESSELGNHVCFDAGSIAVSLGMIDQAKRIKAEKE